MVAKGGVVDAMDVQEVCGAIDGIPLEDLGIDPANTPHSGGGSARSVLRARLAQLQASCGTEMITYLHIHEDELMTIGIFQLPQGARIPLHNHPGMTVFSRLLFGSLHIRAYDWADGERGPPGAQLSRQPHHMHRAASGAGENNGEEEDEEDGASRPRRQHLKQQRAWQRPPSGVAAAGSERGAASSGSGGGSSGSSGPLELLDGSDSSSSSSSTSCGGALGGARAARLVADRVLTAPTPTSVLFPADGGNIHSFTALSPCAVLDVLTPPYAPSCGRDCTYYREVFPPQLLDGAGRPLVMPADDVAAWVRWQQAARGADAAPWQQQGQQQQQQQQQQQEQQQQQHDLRRSSSSSSRDADGDWPMETSSGTPADGATQQQQQQQHPWSALGGAQQGLILGLESAPMPPDFLVDRGIYTGKSVSV